MPVRSKYHAALVQRRWQRVRRLVLAHDRTCRECGKFGVLEVDHIQPLHLGRGGIRHWLTAKSYVAIATYERLRVRTAGHWTPNARNGGCWWPSK